MYLILQKRSFKSDGYSIVVHYSEKQIQNGEWYFQSIFTDDIHKVSECLKIEGNRVYKLDSLTEIKQIDVTYQEIPKELT